MLDAYGSGLRHLQPKRGILSARLHTPCCWLVAQFRRAFRMFVAAAEDPTPFAVVEDAAVFHSTAQFVPPKTQGPAPIDSQALSIPAFRSHRLRDYAGIKPWEDMPLPRLYALFAKACGRIVACLAAFYMV